jgi:hypothetical protein
MISSFIVVRRTLETFFEFVKSFYKAAQSLA